MKPIKALGLAMVAILIATAFAAVSSASADVLCKVNENPCPKGSSYAVGTSFTLETEGETTFSESEGKFKVTCTGGSQEFKTTKDLGAGKGLEASVTSESYKSCTGSCTGVTVEDLPYKAVMKATGEGKGTVTETAEKETGFSLTGCAGTEQPCQYRLAQRTRSFLGGNPMKLDMTQTFARIAGGAACPSQIIEKTIWRGGVLVWIQETFIP